MVFIFIGESIGWQELLLIGTLALIFLGPRRLPYIARKVGKTIAELRKAGQEFKRTWEQEVGLNEEEREFLKRPFDENLIVAEEKYSQVKKIDFTPAETNEDKNQKADGQITEELSQSGTDLTDSETEKYKKQNWL